MKNTLIAIGAAIVLLIGASMWSKSLQLNDTSAVSTNGLHWHPTLEIFVKGEQKAIPVNIGIGTQYAGLPTFDPSMGMTAIHTHTSDGIIHLEFNGHVTKDDIELGNFFRIWGKELSSFGPSVHMTVNGTASSELENYEMKDGDAIVLRYE